MVGAKVSVASPKTSVARSPPVFSRGAAEGAGGATTGAAGCATGGGVAGSALGAWQRDQNKARSASRSSRRTITIVRRRAGEDMARACGSESRVQSRRLPGRPLHRPNDSVSAPRGTRSRSRQAEHSSSNPNRPRERPSGRLRFSQTSRLPQKRRCFPEFDVVRRLSFRTLTPHSRPFRR